MLSKEVVQRVFDAHADASGRLPIDSLHAVVSGVGLPATHRSLVLAQGAMRELFECETLENGIPAAVFHAWYKIETTPGGYDKRNELLVRRIIGKVKLPTRNLKDNQFAYGQKNQADPEGAGEVVLNWVAGKLSQSQEAGVCLIKVNKAAVKAKKTTAKDLNQFLHDNKDAPHLQKPKIVGRKKDQGVRRSVDGMTFGERPVDPANRGDIKKIMCPDAPDLCNGRPRYEEANYADTSGQVRKGRLPKPRPTHGSDVLRAHNLEERAAREAHPEPWKMSKFSKRAQPKISSFRPRQTQQQTQDSHSESKLADDNDAAMEIDGEAESKQVAEAAEA